MADLSAYQDIRIELDFVTNKIKLTDPNNYPVGEANNLIGIFTITQPDGIAIQGEWATPEIYWQSGALVVAERLLRKNADGTPQEGTYTVRYDIDHPDYTPSTITKTFDLSYKRKTLSLSEDFDVFTPLLVYRDNTSFTQSGFTTTTNTVSWAAQIGSVGSKTGSTSNFDLIYSGQYYDAEYNIDFQRDLLYTHNTYTYLTVRDRYIKEIITTADTPPSVNDIVLCINELKLSLDNAAGTCALVDSLEAKYQKAVVRYDHLIHKLTLGDSDDAEDLLAEILNLTACSHTVYRNTPIAPYDLSAYASGSGGGYLNYFYTIPSDVTEVTLVAMNGKVIGDVQLGGIGKQFTNGADGDVPDAGKFIAVDGSTPRKFKYGGTLFKDDWLKISYIP